MAQLFPSCLDAARRISEAHDAPIGRLARVGLWLHLAVCGYCRRYSRQIRHLQCFVREYPDRLSRVKLPEHTRAEIIRKLTGQT